MGYDLDTDTDTYAYTDGNELAGPLSEIFTQDATGAVSRCAHCGRDGPLATLRLYGRAPAPGWVARCPACDSVMLRLVRGPASAWLDLHGTSVLQLAMPPPPP